MSDSRHETAGRIFLEAMEHDGPARSRYLDEACADDRALRDEVESLLAAADVRIDLLDNPQGARMSTGLRTPPVDRLVGSRIGRYQVRRVIASGGMGVVYEAEQDHPSRKVALKVIRRGLFAESALRRFRFEAQLLGHLQHPGIAQIYELGVYDDGGEEFPYFAMEYVPSAQSLTVFAKSGKLSRRDRLKLFVQVCDAVHHGHLKGIVHRDLKPANVLIDASGRPKIIDFGVARATDSDLQVTTIQTEAGQLVGTIPYMSPEQVDGDPTKLDARSDVYSLGVLLYELLSGRMPHDLDNRTLADAIRTIRERDPIRLVSVDRQFRGDIDTIVAKALEKEPDRRYQSAAEFAADVSRYLSDNPIMARPASAVYQMRKFAKRNRGLVSGIVATIIALAVGTGVSIRYAIEAGAQARAAALEAERASRRFEQARELARTFIFDFDDQIKDLPGSTAPRAFLVERGLKYVDDLAADAEGQSELLLEMAEAYDRMGDVQGLPNFANLGNLPGAIESYQKSIQIRTALCESRPDDLGLHLQLAISHNRMATVYKTMGEIALSMEHAQSYLRILEPFHLRDPDNTEIQFQMTWGHNELGKCFRSIGQLDRALDEFQKCLTIREAVVAARPDDIKAIRELSAGRIKIAEVHALRGEHEAALEQFRSAHSDRLKLAASQPNSRLAQRDLSFTYGKIGESLVELNRPEEAQAQFEKSHQIRQMLHERDPSDSGARSDLAIGCYRLGSFHVSVGNLDAALGRFKEFLSIARELSAAQPENVRLRGFVAEGHSCVGDVYLRLGDHAAATSEMLAGLKVIERLAEDSPSNLQNQIQLADTLERLGSVYRAAGRLPEALEQCERVAELRGRILDVDPDNPKSRWSAAASKIVVGEICLALLADFDRSIEAHSMARSKAERCFRSASSLLDGIENDSLPGHNVTQLAKRCEAGLAACNTSVDRP